MLPAYAEDDLRGALAAVGVQAGETIVVHSSLMHLGVLAGDDIATYPARLTAVLRDVLGPDGTLCVPAAFWEYGAKRLPFDLVHSEVTQALGVLGRHVRRLPGALRSLNPIFSVAAVGPQAEFICRGGTTTAFGVDSAWDRLYRMNARMVFLGCDLSRLTLIRYIETRFGVPYLYTKLFHRPVLEDGRELAATTSAPLRYMHCPVTYGLAPFEQRLREAGLLAETPLGAGAVKAVLAHPCFDAGIAALKEDPHAFLAVPPPYDPDQVPMI